MDIKDKVVQEERLILPEFNAYKTQHTYRNRRTTNGLSTNMFNRLLKKAYLHHTVNTKRHTMASRLIL